MKIIKIEWVDAHREDGWRSKEWVEEYWGSSLEVIKQVGYLVKEDKDWLILAMGVGADKTYLCTHKIPKKMIKKRTSLNE